MRKVLIGVAIASALFATGAFAANFTVSSEDIASGRNDVVACAARVDVDFTTTWSDTAQDWLVSAAVVKFYPATGTTPTAACGGYGTTVVVGTAGDASAANGEATVGATATSVTVPLSPATLTANAVTRAAVLVDGEELVVATPGNGQGGL